jgi:hypothetical protein
MLGGGTFTAQNKTLPGAYINFVNASAASSTLGERGIVAVALPLSTTTAGKVVTCTAFDFYKNKDAVLGASADANSVKTLGEIFKHATKVYIYDTYTASDASAPTVATICAAFEPYEFNILCAYTATSADVTSYIAQVKSWRDTMGKKCQVVVYNATAPDHEGVINVISTVTDEDADAHALVAWVAGAEAGCALNESCTNMLYDGEYTIKVDKTQTQLETCITSGQIAFHLVYGEVRMLEDINSLTTTTTEKGSDFKNNQTIRVIDQIANDIAKLFNTKYLGRIPNNASGRVSLWGDIVAHHRNLQLMQAIENFDSSLVTVTQGDTKKSVVVNDVITVTNAMSQLYMTLVIQ